MMVLVIGCDSSHSLQNHLQDYQQRMANVLEVESPDNLTISLPPYPALRELKLDIPATTIKLFEFTLFNIVNCIL